MAEDKVPESARRGSYADLSMNVVAASSTAEPAETVRRKSRLWMVLVAMVVAAAALAWVAGKLSNLPPGEEADIRLQGALQNLDVWQRAIVTKATYEKGNTLRVQFTPQISTETDQGRAALRAAALDVMNVFRQQRPGRDLYINGYQGDEQVLEAEYSVKGSLPGPGGQPVPNIVVHVKGDPKGGIGTLAKPDNLPTVGR
jgi:hypothetical protein